MKSQVDIGLLILRASLGLMMLGHGFGKVRSLLAGQISFPDPLGIGSAPSLALAAFAEFLCAILVVVGWKVRWSAVPLVVTMLVAAFIHHAGDPWGDKELALVYAAGFLALVFTDGGRYSLDSLLRRRRRRR